MRITDYIKDENTNEGFYPDANYLALQDAVDIPLEFKERKMFENDKGCGVAILCKDAEHNLWKLVTHSAPICSLMANELLDDPVEVLTFTVKKGKSKKTGMAYYYLE